MIDTAARGMAGADRGPIRHLLSAVYQALDLPLPHHPADRVRYLTLLERRAALALGSIGRLIANSQSDDLDYFSEGDHILHLIADLPPDTYRHGPAAPA